MHYDTGDTGDNRKQQDATSRLASANLVAAKGEPVSLTDYGESHYGIKVKRIAKDGGNYYLERMDEQKKLGGRGVDYVRSTVDISKLKNMTAQ